MFGKAQGQKENPGLAKPSQTLRGNAIFDRRNCETGNWELGTGNWERGTRPSHSPNPHERQMRISRDKGVVWKNKGKDKMKNSELSLAELLKKYGLDDESADTVSTDENTPPATAETPVAPPSRARVEDIKLINASARIHETTTDNSDKFKQWRKTKFGGDFDLVAEAVGEALRAFKPDNPELTRKVWLKIANAIGYSNFLDAMYQQQSLIQEYENRGKKCWNKALLFHRLLNKRFPLPKSKGGAK